MGFGHRHVAARLARFCELVQPSIRVDAENRGVVEGPAGVCGSAGPVRQRGKVVPHVAPLPGQCAPCGAIFHSRRKRGGFFLGLRSFPPVNSFL